MPRWIHWIAMIAWVLGIALIVRPESAVGMAEGPARKVCLSEQIDRWIERGHESELAAPATDSEFLRRLSLDLTGVIPTADEARAFLDDPSPYKRARKVDELLGSPAFVRRMTDVLDLMWMERRPASNVPDAEWRRFLFDSLAENVPYDELVRRVLAADGSVPGQRGAARFVLDRGSDPHLLTRDVGRLFLGRDMQCAQCHDHPIVDDYKQAHYYGLFAYLSRVYPQADARGVMTVGEKADGDVTFRSVFKKTEEHRTDPRLLDGPVHPDPSLVVGREYWAYPVANLPARPRHSRRALLGRSLTNETSGEFARNAANRLWAAVMGRGFVQPLDMSHAENPATHPELLELLAKEFAGMNYDMRAYLRALVMTRTYQRSSEPPPPSPTESAETEGEEADSPFSVAAIRPMSPEQLGWSVMQAVGIVAANREEIARQRYVIDGRMRDIAALDSRRGRMVALMAEQQLDDRLRGSLSGFVQQFGGVAGQAQEGGQSTVHQALFLSNGDPLQSWLAPSGRNLTARLGELSDAGLLAEELYLAVLTRRPTVEERADVAAYLEGRAEDRPVAIRELTWALISSSEFRFNH